MTPDEQPQPVASELRMLGYEIDGVIHDIDYSGKSVADEVCMRTLRRARDALLAHPPTSAASQPDFDIVRGVIHRMRWYADDGERPDEWLLKDWANELERALNPPAESAARGDVPNATPKAEADPFADKYHELLMAVASKFPGESRHATALRYINERENLPTHGPAQNATPTSGGVK